MASSVYVERKRQVRLSGYQSRLDRGLEVLVRFARANPCVVFWLSGALALALALALPLPNRQTHTPPIC
jgi:hypothetical protein